MRNSSEIWVYGTFDVDNFGDLLFPYILDKKIGSHGRIVPVSPEGIRTQYIDAIPASPVSLNGKPLLIIIGGGNIITRQLKHLSEHPTWRFDTDLAALSIWIGPLFQALRLRVPLFWNMPGFLGQLEFTGPLKDAINRWINESSTYPVRLRDQSSARAFGKFYEGPIEVYPDSAFSLIDILPKEVLVKHLRFVRQKYSIFGSYLICHIKADYVDINYEEIARVIAEIAHVQDLAVVLLPLAPCHGDIKAVHCVAEFLGSRHILIEDAFSLKDTTTLLACASLTITSSYHAAIVCSQYESNFHVVAPRVLDKFDDLERSLGFSRLESWSELSVQVKPANARDVASKAAVLNRRLAEHWNDLERLCSAEKTTSEVSRRLPSDYIDQQPVARSAIFSSLIQKPKFQSNRDKCPICSSTRFAAAGAGHLRLKRVCSVCGSRPRHRAVFSAVRSLNIDFSKAKGLMFSRDPSIKPSWFDEFEFSIYGAKNTLNLEDIDRSNDSYDFIVLNHVLEHVSDDKKALLELERILKPNGYLLITVPSPSLFNYTTDWGFPDPALHLHYRTYGRDIYMLIQRTCASLTVYEMETLDPITNTPDYMYFCHKSDRRIFEPSQALSLRLSPIVNPEIKPVLEDGIWHLRRLLVNRCFARARRALDKLIFSFPDDLRVVLLEADYFHLRKDFFKERELLLNASRKSTNNKAVILRLARQLYVNGEPQDALALLIESNLISDSTMEALHSSLQPVLYFQN